MRHAGGNPGPSYEQQAYDDDQPSTSSAAPNGTAERNSHDGDDMYIKHTVGVLVVVPCVIRCHGAGR